MLGLRTYKRYKKHFLNDDLERKRKQKSKQPLPQYANEQHQLERILFTNEKTFTVEESFNKPHDKIYASDLLGSELWRSDKHSFL